VATIQHIDGPMVGDCCAQNWLDCSSNEAIHRLASDPDLVDFSGFWPYCSGFNTRLSDSCMSSV